MKSTQMMSVILILMECVQMELTILVPILELEIFVMLMALMIVLGSIVTVEVALSE